MTACVTLWHGRYMHARPSSSPVLRPCGECGSPILAVRPTGRQLYPSQYSRLSFCSPLCAAFARGRKRKKSLPGVKLCCVCANPISAFQRSGLRKSASIYARAKYCSASCYFDAKSKIARRPSLREHFEALRDTSGGPDSCWPISPSCQGRSGYGYFSYKGAGHWAHRLAVTFDGRTVPDGLFVLHLCDNPPCCNPRHLMVGTLAENNKQMHERGRAARRPKGMSHPACRLSVGQVEQIRALMRGGDVSANSLARRFGVGHPTVLKAARGLAPYTLECSEPPCVNI